MLDSLAYVSRATRRFSLGALEALLLDARAFNADAAVTGVLFHHDGRFFQYIEGPPEGLAGAYRRIEGATSHTGIELLMREETPHRHFDAWHMGFCEAPGSALQELAQASWEQSLPVTDAEVEAFPGLGLAMFYWSKWSADASRGS